MIETFIIVITSIIIGYLMGRNALNKETIDNITKSVKRQFRSDYVGPVNRPTAKQLNEWNNPLLKETNDAMREAMKDMPK